MPTTLVQKVFPRFFPIIILFTLQVYVFVLFSRFFCVTFVGPYIDGRLVDFDVLYMDRKLFPCTLDLHQSHGLLRKLEFRHSQKKLQQQRTEFSLGLGELFSTFLLIFLTLCALYDICYTMGTLYNLSMGEGITFACAHIHVNQFNFCFVFLGLIFV